ncbi:MAG: sulfur oxidation c-type cytochrome SoxX [Gammaproteobacteria bacterium]|nr:sulfur oxidation c-type cytochrome SoxX [Gammaproteobacteria bacterium]
MKIRLITSATSIVALLSVLSSPVVTAASQAELIAEGKRISFHRQLGNCLTCHAMPGAGGESPGNVGPPLIAMKARFPDKQVLRDQIWDSTARNPGTMMPPFGKHNILTEEQIDAVTEFVHSL